MSTTGKRNPKLKNINRDTIKVLEDGFLRCAICLEMVEEPKCLNCLHKFCAKCLEDYIISRKTLPGQNFSCPNRCTEKTVLPPEGVSGLKTDFYVLGIQSFLKKKTSQRKNVQNLFGNGQENNNPDQDNSADKDSENESDYENPDYEEPTPPTSATRPDLPPRSTITRTPSMQRETLKKDICREIDEVGQQIAMADHKIALCEAAIEKFNTLGNKIFDAIELQESIMIKDIKKKSEAMKNRALEIMESERIKLQRTLDETRKHQEQLASFKYRAEVALNLEDVNLDSAIKALPPKEDLQRPIQELSLTVERTAQREASLFNLIVQKTILHVRKNPPVKSRSGGQCRRHNAGFSLLSEQQWYLAGDSDEDPDEFSDRFLAEVRRRTERYRVGGGGAGAGDGDGGRSRVTSTDSGFNEPGSVSTNVNPFLEYSHY